MPVLNGRETLFGLIIDAFIAEMPFCYAFMKLAVSNNLL